MAFPIPPLPTTLRRLGFLSACLCLSARAAAPFVATQPATPLNATSVTLNGMVLPNGEATTAWFEWGPQGSYAHQTASMDAGAGPVVVRVSAPPAGLTSGQVYQCRLVASNASGTSYGAKMLFTAGQKVIEWGETVCGAVSIPPGLTNMVAISANSCYSMALKNDGTVLVWGNNGYLNLPAFASSLTNIMAIAQGDSHSLAIQADGTVVAWGDNSYGQTNVPTGLQNVAAVSAGATHSVALGADGTVVAWGDNSSGQTNVPPALSNVVAIASGLAHNLALKADGTVVAWGRNLAGETNVPPGLTNAVAVSAGDVSSEALLSDGSVVAWARR